MADSFPWTADEEGEAAMREAEAAMREAEPADAPWGNCKCERLLFLRNGSATCCAYRAHMRL